VGSPRKSQKRFAVPSQSRVQISAKGRQVCLNKRSIAEAIVDLIGAPRDKRERAVQNFMAFDEIELAYMLGELEVVAAYGASRMQSSPEILAKREAAKAKMKDALTKLKALQRRSQ
jgi:hypothetical protein